jgi:hypothetical protein
VGWWKILFPIGSTVKVVAVVSDLAEIYNVAVNEGVAISTNRILAVEWIEGTATPARGTPWRMQFWGRRTHE